ncbi:MAG: CDGSH iron-sulfur domain-containing protein [Alphaproteobacteria bacterium]|nr:CDGSH iron-sulfur domain-containing protein [Alphaproteobacteria bacterium]
MSEQKLPYIKITENGPYLLYGATKISEKIILTDENGISVKYGDGKTFEIKSDPVCLCRCGHSKNAPFCDGSHADAMFIGTETAVFTPIMKQPSAEAIRGPTQTLLDNQQYCAFARFCDRGGRVWNLVMEGGKAADKLSAEEANLCPAGRLMMFTNDGKLLEENTEPQVHTIEDGGLHISGPLWIRGGIRVESADGRSYEVRQKQTLCRCGASANKPFCNGAHASMRFKAKTAK